MKQHGWTCYLCGKNDDSNTDSPPKDWAVLNTGHELCDSCNQNLERHKIGQDLFVTKPITRADAEKHFAEIERRPLK